MSAPLEKTKTPGVYKRGGRYVYVYRDNLGRQRRRLAATMAEAKAARSAALADVARGEYRTVSRVTFAAYARQWIDTYTGRTRRGISDDTREDYRRRLGLDREGNMLADGAMPFFGGKRLAELEPRDIRAYAAHVAARGVSRDTVRLALAPVKALLATAHEDGAIRTNPAAGLRNLLPADEHEAEAEKVRALKEEQLAAILGKLPERVGFSRPRLFFAFLAQSGLRYGEAVELRWGDFDLGGGWVHVQRRFRNGRVGLPKGRKTRRVRLTREMCRALWELRKETRGGDDDLVFVAERGGRLVHANLLRRVLKPAARAAEVGEWVGCHTFRHTCATILFRRGWNASQVQRFLGHSDPGFTLRRYVHLLDSDLPEPTFFDGLAATSGGEESGADRGSAAAEADA